jgi:hypothetical protein
MHLTGLILIPRMQSLYPNTRLHGITTQKTTVCTLTIRTYKKLFFLSIALYFNLPHLLGPNISKWLYILTPKFSTQLADRWWWACQPHILSFTPGRLVSISVKGWTDHNGHNMPRTVRLNEKSYNLNGNRTRDLPACSTESASTMLRKHFQYIGALSFKW